MFAFLNVVLATPKSTPYFVYCYRDNPPLQYRDAVGTGMANLIQAAIANWDKRRDLRKRQKGPFIKVRGIEYYSYQSEETEQCFTKEVYWNGGCRESPTCLNVADCNECLSELTGNLVQNLCPTHYRARAHAMDCFAHFTNLEIMPAPRDEEMPVWPIQYE